MRAYTVMLNQQQWAEVLECLWWEATRTRSSYLNDIARSLQDQVEKQTQTSLIDIDPRDALMTAWDGESDPVPAL